MGWKFQDYGVTYKWNSLFSSLDRILEESEIFS